MKNKTKEARLIQLQSGIYIYLPICRKARPSFLRVLHNYDIEVKLRRYNLKIKELRAI